MVYTVVLVRICIRLYHKLTSVSELGKTVRNLGDFFDISPTIDVWIFHSASHSPYFLVLSGKILAARGLNVITAEPPSSQLL